MTSLVCFYAFLIFGFFTGSLVGYTLDLNQGNDHDLAKPLEVLQNLVQGGMNDPVRSKRDVKEIISMIGSLTDGFNNIPGFPGLGGLNLQGIITTSSELMDEGFNNMKCCREVGVPSTLMNNIEVCGRSVIEDFITKISDASKQGKGSMVEPLVSDSVFYGLLDGGMCVMQCAFSAMNLTNYNGLPDTDKMVSKLPQLVNANAMEVLTPAIQACGTEMQRAVEKLGTGVTQKNACWAGNSFLDCMNNHVYMKCPNERKQQGGDCLIKLGKQFWADLPDKVSQLYDDMKAKFTQ